MNRVFGADDLAPRSYNLMPLHYFLLRYIQAHVYRDKTAAVKILEANIEEFFRVVPADMLESVSKLH